VPFFDLGRDEGVKGAREYKSPYERWKELEGIPTLRGYYVKNLLDVELTPWESRGGAGVFINLEGNQGFNDSYVYELEPKESSQPVRHIYEETVYILKGQGATTVWTDDNHKQTFEWHKSSFFAIPPNAWHQHHNLSGNEPARYFGMTAAPRVIDTFKSLDFVFNNPYVFNDRFKSDDGYFKQAERGPRGGYVTNYVSDVLGTAIMAETAGYSEGRGPGVRSTGYTLVNGTMHNHSSSWPIGVYKRAHRHGPGINVMILRGEGYSTMWHDSMPVERCEWGPGSVFVPGEGWWHQHFNTGAEPCLFLAIGWGSEKPKSGGGTWSSAKTGDEIMFDEEDPAVHREFEAELARNGVKCRMGDVHPFCTAK
jgi:quercetin dioxygenase-like cupin family protein